MGLIFIETLLILNKILLV